MSKKVVEAALNHVARIKELREKAKQSVNYRKEAMHYSSSWAIRQAAAVDFLVTHEELEIYVGALLAAKEKMRRMM